MNFNKDTIWVPEESDREMMRLMFSIGKTYNEYYFFNYGKDLGMLFEWLSLAITRMDHRHELFGKDKKNYHTMREKLKGKIEDIINPRFKPGDLVNCNHGICTVVGSPRVDELYRKVVVDVLLEGSVIPVNLNTLKSVGRFSKKINP